MARTTSSSRSKARSAKDRPTAIDQAKTPLLAAIGAGDVAFTTVLGAVTDARARAEERAETTRERLNALPEEIEELRSRLAPEELRKVAEAYVQAAAQIYVSLAERGGEALGRVRKAPQVDDIVTRAGDAREEAKELTDEVLGTVARQTRSIGERAARATERMTARAGSAAGKAGTATEGAGEELAHDLRSTSRRAANAAAGAGSAPSDRPSATTKATPARKAAAKTATAGRAAARKATAAKATAASTADTAAATVKDVASTAAAAQDEATGRTTPTS